MGGNTHAVPYIWDAEYLPILYFAWFKGMKMDNFILDRKNKSIIAFDKPMWKIFSQYQDW